MRCGINHEKSRGVPSPNIHKLANTLDTRCLVEVACTNRLAHHIKIRACGDNLHLLHLHDVLELHPDFARLSQELGMEEVFHAPIIAEPVSQVDQYKRV